MGRTTLRIAMGGPALGLCVACSGASGSGSGGSGTWTGTIACTGMKIAATGLVNYTLPKTAISPPVRVTQSGASEAYGDASVPVIVTVINGLPVGPLIGWSCPDATVLAQYANFGGPVPPATPLQPGGPTTCAGATGADLGPMVLLAESGGYTPPAAGTGAALSMNVIAESGTIDADGGIVTGAALPRYYVNCGYSLRQN